MARKVEHEITLIAVGRDAETGKRVIRDIVETSRHFASKFARGWMRDPEVTEIGAGAPGAQFGAIRFKAVK